MTAGWATMTGGLSGSARPARVPRSSSICMIAMKPSQICMRQGSKFSKPGLVPNTRLIETIRPSGPVIISWGSSPDGPVDQAERRECVPNKMAEEIEVHRVGIDALRSGCGDGPGAGQILQCLLFEHPHGL